MANHMSTQQPEKATPITLAVEVPKSILVPAAIQPREREVSQQVNDYFLAHWPFANDEARRKFVKAGFPRVTCAYFPSALDDRIHFACRLLTLLFLVDGKLRPMQLGTFGTSKGRAFSRLEAPVLTLK